MNVADLLKEFDWSFQWDLHQVLRNQMGIGTMKEFDPIFRLRVNFYDSLNASGRLALIKEGWSW